MSSHVWTRSPLGHGSSYCRNCHATMEELAITGDMNECKAASVATAPSPDVEKVARAIADVIAKRHGHAHTDWMNDERREEARAALAAMETGK